MSDLPDYMQDEIDESKRLPIIKEFVTAKIAEGLIRPRNQKTGVGIADDIEQLLLKSTKLVNGQPIGAGGVTLDELYAGMRESRDHWAPAIVTPGLEEMAWVQNNQTARGKLLAALDYDMDRFAESAHAFGVSADVKRDKRGKATINLGQEVGKMPEYAEDGTKAPAKKKSAERNPWYAEPGQKTWRPEQFKAQLAVARANVANAQSLASSAGSWLGCPYPGCKSLISRAS